MFDSGEWVVAADRSVLTVCGSDSTLFLQGLLTVDLASLPVRSIRAWALLTPQGKVVAEGMLVRAKHDEYWLEMAQATAALVRFRLERYRLRAVVDLVSRGDIRVYRAWCGAADLHDTGTEPDFPKKAALLGPRGTRCSEGSCATVGAIDWYEDPRDGLSARIGFGSSVVDPMDPASGRQVPAARDLRHWHEYLASCGVPECARDYAHDGVTPFEANLDLMGAISTTKGCYIGQEVVARMIYRGSIRTRSFSARVPEAVLSDRHHEIAPGLPVELEGRRVGVSGAWSGMVGTVRLRMDRIPQTDHELEISPFSCTSRDEVAFEIRVLVPLWRNST